MERDGAETEDTWSESPVTPDSTTYPEDELYEVFGVIDPLSRVGRQIEAFNKLKIYEPPKLTGYENHITWSEAFLTYIPDRCRQIIEHEEAECPERLAKDPDSKAMWEAMNARVYRMIWHSLDPSVALKTFQPQNRSAYLLWQRLDQICGYPPEEEEGEEEGEEEEEEEEEELPETPRLLKKLVLLRPREWPEADERYVQEVIDVVKELAKNEYSVDEEFMKMVLGVVPKRQRQINTEAVIEAGSKFGLFTKASFLDLDIGKRKLCVSWIEILGHEWSIETVLAVMMC